MGCNWNVERQLRCCTGGYRERCWRPHHRLETQLILFHQRECSTNSDNEKISGDFKHCLGKMFCDRIVHPFDGVISGLRSCRDCGAKPQQWDPECDHERNVEQGVGGIPEHEGHPGIEDEPESQ